MLMKRAKKANSEESLKELPLITVITLSYKSVYLYDAINSVLSQNYPFIQYIISDDGTEGFNKESLLHYIDENNKGNICEVLVLHNETNMGIVANYNRALRAAKGKYIFPLAADDKYVNESVLYRWTTAFSQVDAPVMCAYCDNYDETMNTFLGRWPRPDHARLLQEGDTSKIYHVMERVKIIPGASMARTLESLQTLGFFDETYFLLEDYPFLMKMLRKGVKIAFWPHSAVMRRGGGVSDGNKRHPLLDRDMELFYEREVYRFSSDPEGLRRSIEQQRIKSLNIRTFSDKWASSGMLGKLALCFRSPSCFARKVYHKLLKT